MACTSGYLHPSEGQFGITPLTSEDKNLCMNNDQTSYCQAFYDQAGISKLLYDTCHDQEKCQIQLSDIKKFFFYNTATNQTLIDKCGDGTAGFFTQMPCKFHTDEITERKIQGLLIATMGVFISLFFVVYVDYLRATFKNLNIEWDVKTITAGDYSVEVDITEKMWKNFDDAPEYNKDSHLSKLAQFRDFLKEKLEDNITEMPDLGYEDEPPEKIIISMITFAFDNADLINLLKKRGLFIKAEKYDDMRKINTQIDVLNSKNVEKYNRPVTAFLTFENEEGLNRCKSYSDVVTSDDQFKHMETILGEKLSFEDAAEPTDIIWENRRFTALQRL